MAHDVPEAPVGSSPSEQADVTGRSPTDLAGGGHRAGAAEAPPAVPAPETPQPSPEPGKPRKLLYVTLPGCWGALIAGCLSFTPSLLPRGGIVQGLIWGIGHRLRAQQPGRPLLIKGGCVLTLDRSIGDFEVADVLIQGKAISAVQPNITARRRRDDRRQPHDRDAGPKLV